MEESAKTSAFSVMTSLKGYCLLDCGGDKFKALREVRFQNVDRRRLGDWIRAGGDNPVD